MLISTIDPNPIIQSLVPIAKQDIVRHMLQCRQHAKKEFGERYNKMVAEIAVEIFALKEKCKPGTSFFAVGQLMTIQSDDETENEAEENAKYIWACVAQIYLDLYNRKYNLEEDE